MTQEDYDKDAEIAALKAELAAVRELMNRYNLGGWTDAVEPMKRALKAEAELAEARHQCKVANQEHFDMEQELAALKEQASEPVGKVRVHTSGGNAGLAWSVVDLAGGTPPYLKDGTLLFTTPQPSAEVWKVLKNWREDHISDSQLADYIDAMQKGNNNVG